MSTKIKIFGSKNLNGLERRVNDWRCSQVNEFDTNAFAEGLIINFQQLNRAFSKIGYDAKLATIKWRKVLHYGKNNKDRREGRPVYRSRAYIKALQNRKRR